MSGFFTTDQWRIDLLQQSWIEWQAAHGKCLHIGCGEKYILGAVNIDARPSCQWADQIMNAQALDFPDSTFDVVVSNHVLPAIEDIDKALREMGRVLVPGGMMAHVVPDTRYAPVRQDWRHKESFGYQYHAWAGPDEFRPVLARHADLFEVVELADFDEFRWSFKVVVRRI